MDDAVVTVDDDDDDFDARRSKVSPAFEANKEKRKEDFFLLPLVH